MLFNFEHIQIEQCSKRILNTCESKHAPKDEYNKSDDWYDDAEHDAYPEPWDKYPHST